MTSPPPSSAPAPSPTPFGWDRLTAPVRREALQWAGLGVAALALAGVLALLLAMARTPVVQEWLPWPWESFFHKALVSHVVLSVVVWFLAVLGALLTLAVGQLRLSTTTETAAATASWSAAAGPGLAAMSLVLLTLPALLDLGAPSLNNYVPVLDHPLYAAGLLTLSAAIALPAIRLLAALASAWTGRRTLPQGPVIAAGAAAVAYLAALACFALGYGLTPAMADRKEYFEWVFWGGGHVLQLVNALVMLACWSALIPAAFGRPLAGPRLTLAVTGPIALTALAAPLLYLLPGYPGTAAYTGFTALYAWALGPLLGVAGLLALRALWSTRTATPGTTADAGTTGTDPARVTLWLSLVVCGVGGLFGFLSGHGDTRTPAHYHAAIGAVNLAAFALVLGVLLPLARQRMSGAGCGNPSMVSAAPSPRGRRVRLAMPWLYGVGTLLHSTGLFLAGAAGVARKTAGADQALDSGWKLASMGLMGAGGLIAVIGGILFIALAGRGLLGGGTPPAGPAARPMVPREDPSS